MSNGSPTTIPMSAVGPGSTARVDSLRRGLVLLTAAIPALALVLGGIAKTDDPFLAAQFLSKALRIRLLEGFDVARAIGAAELITGVSLCIFAGRSRLPPYGALGLFTFFVGLLTRVYIQDPRLADCGCFGSLAGRWLQQSLPTQIAIDLGLAGLLVVHLLLTRAERKARAPAT